MSKFYPGKFIFSILTLAFISLQASAQITTIAGRHTYLGDNGLATSAGLFGPYSFTRDSIGNTYIATYADNRVRKVDAVTNVITTIAGTGIAGYSGDGGLATAAQLKFNNSGLPGIAVDKAGNIYIGDFLNNRIRKIDAVSKIITTIAGTGTGGTSPDGTLAVSAKISNPAGIVIDNAGNIYFADNGNNLVRKIDAVTKNISTVAPGTVLGYAECLALDKKGNLYISDEFNSIIRKVDAVTQAVTTVAGNGIHGYSGDGGAATGASLGYTMGVVVDTTGNIYIADQSNNRIRKVDAVTLKISTIAGTGSAGYFGDGGLASAAQVYKPTTLQIDKAGNLYIDDFGNNRIRKITASTNIISTIAGDGTDGFTGAPYAYQAQLAPQAVTLDAAGNVYIAEGNYYDVRIVAPGNYTYNYAGKPNPDAKFASKGYSGNGNLASAALYNTPFGVAVDAGNNVYIADVFNNVIRKVAYSTKYVTTIAGTSAAGFAGDGAAATSAQLNNPYGIAVDKSGNLYIADANNNRIRKITAATQVITTIAGNGTAGSAGDGGLATAANLNSPRGMAIDTAGNVFILDKGNNKIRMLTASTQKISTVFSNGHALTGVATDVTGNIYVSDSTAGTVIKVDYKTYLGTIVAGTGTPGFSGDGGAATSAQLNYPGGLFVNNAGNIYVADINNLVVRKIIPPVVVVTTTPIKNNVVSTIDSTATCTGKINITTFGGTLPTGGTGTYTYKWLQSADSITYIPVANAIAQTFSVNGAITTTTYYRRLVSSGTYSDSGNVVGFHVRINPVPVITTGALAICKGVKDTLKTTAAFTKYAWSTGAVASQIIDSISGSFYVTATDAYGCTGKSASVSITVNALPATPVITSNPSSTANLCTGTSAVLTSSAAAKYAWSNGATTQAVTVTAAGSFTVTIKDANGCANTSAAKAVSYQACLAPAIVGASGVTGTTATLTWKATACAVKYQVQYAVSGTTAWTTVTTTNTDTNYKLTGLKKSTTYAWQVSAVCAVSPLAASAYSASATFKTTSAASLLGENPISSVDESSAIGKSADLAVYPNPAVSSARLNIKGLKGKVAIVIADVSGRIIWYNEVEGVAQLNIPVEKLSAGMYLITVTNEKYKKTLRFVTQ